MCRNLPFALTLIALCSGACTPAPEDDGPKTDSDATVDTVTDTVTDTDTDTETDTGTPVPNMRVSFSGFLSGDPLAGASVTLGEETKTTNEDGATKFALDPGMVYELSVQQNGFGPIRILGTMGNVTHSDGLSPPSLDTIDLLKTYFGIELVEGTGIFVCLIQQGTPNARNNLPGSTATIDADYELAMVQDFTDTTGLSVGDVTLEGQTSTIVFAGVPAGAITPTVVPPPGYTCLASPETAVVDPGGWTAVRLYCTQD